MNTEALKSPSRSVTKLQSRLYGCWLGKSIGGTLGLPAEGKTERLNFSFYDPIPTSAPPNDDLELQLVWLDLVEKGGARLTQDDFAQAWLRSIQYMWDEYGRCRWNLRRGVPVKSVGTFENPFHAGMGAPIRSEIWACLFPGDSDSAAYYAALDASLDHGTEGIAGEVFLSALQSDAAVGVPLEEAIAKAMRYLPNDCELTRAIELVQDQRLKGIEAWECWKELLAQFGNENFTHAPLNVALTIWALVYGDEDFEKSILLAVNGGYDTDCTAATVGATLGFYLGEAGIPECWSSPIGDGVFVGSGIQWINAPKTLGELTDRVLSLVGKLEKQEWSDALLQPPTALIDLSILPGTISIVPFGSPTAVPWANGELPDEVKKAGGATWIWESTSNDPRRLVCLARLGAKLFLNGELAIECPEGLPYVPATHRCPIGSSVIINPGPGSHEIRLELSSASIAQETSVILAYENYHLAPWSKQELPFLSNLVIG